MAACYACLKRRAGLFGYTENGKKRLTERERFHIGSLPRYEPDPRSLGPAAVLLAAERRDEEYYQAIRGLRYLVDLAGETHELVV